MAAPTGPAGPEGRGGVSPLTPRPEDIEAIQADLFRSTYQARRLARLRLLGREPAPVVDADLARWVGKMREQRAERTVAE